ncbi:MAG: Pvc16 family protein [Cyanobacteria bacterium J06632_3]
MLPSVAYTLADFLNSGLPSVNSESIRFEHPSFVSAGYPSLNLYLYDIGRSPQSGRWSASGRLPLAWFNTVFLLTVQEKTQLGQQRLVTAAFNHCRQHPYLPNHHLAPALRGHGQLPLQAQPIGAEAWQGLGVPTQPGLCLTLTVPFEAIRSALPIMA